MDGRLALLGRPRIERRDRAVPLAGRKPWGLLAYLCLEHQATRHDLAALLFSAADDPLAALRWSLLQVRRALTGLAEVGERQGRLSIALADGVEVDVARVLSGDVSAYEAGRLRSGELLAGLAFDDEPGSTTGSCSSAAGSAPPSPRRMPGPRRPWPPPTPTPRWT
jgi:DNA-binding SARP family transcriptional activator